MTNIYSVAEHLVQDAKGANEWVRSSFRRMVTGDRQSNATRVLVAETKTFLTSRSPFLMEQRVRKTRLDNSSIIIEFRSVPFAAMSRRKLSRCAGLAITRHR